MLSHSLRSLAKRWTGHLASGASRNDRSQDALGDRRAHAAIGLKTADAGEGSPRRSVRRRPLPGRTHATIGPKTALYVGCQVAEAVGKGRLGTDRCASLRRGGSACDACDRSGCRGSLLEWRPARLPRRGRGSRRPAVRARSGPLVDAPVPQARRSEGRTRRAAAPPLRESPRPSPAPVPSRWPCSRSAAAWSVAGSVVRMCSVASFVASVTAPATSIRRTAATVPG